MYISMYIKRPHTWTLLVLKQSSYKYPLKAANLDYSYPLNELQEDETK